MLVRARSYPRRRRLPSTAIVPAVGPSPSPRRRAAAKSRRAVSVCSGSSRRNNRLNVSWLGVSEAGKSMISTSSARLASAKSAMSTQVFAPHSVAARAMNNRAGSSYCAVWSRGSLIEAKIPRSVSIARLSCTRGRFSESRYFPQARGFSYVRLAINGDVVRHVGSAQSGPSERSYDYSYEHSTMIRPRRAIWDQRNGYGTAAIAVDRATSAAPAGSLCMLPPLTPRALPIARSWRTNARNARWGSPTGPSPGSIVLGSRLNG